MESLTNQYGYEDSLFISDVPDYLHCIICTLVLRDPVQILQCGHKYCHVCFERIKQQALTTGVDLLCPVDREIVDLNAVHPDVGMGRIVGNLTVRCHEHENGCSWNGDLRQLDSHHEECQHRIRSESSVVTVTDDAFKEFSERLDRYETALQEKDQQIASLDLKLHQQEQQLQQQKQQLQLQENKLHQQKQLQQQLQQEKHEREQQHQLLLDQNKLLREEVSQLKEEVNLLRKEVTSGLDRRKAVPEEASATPVNAPLKKNSTIPKKQTVAPNKIVVQHHSGLRENIIISDSYHRVEFKRGFGGWSTVSAPAAVVLLGAKVWYEVHYLPSRGPVYNRNQRIGWATNDLPISENHCVTGVGDSTDSYGFDPFCGEKWHGGRTTWGKKITRSDGGYVGIALDTVKGEVWFSLNGNWNEPNGIAFSGVNTRKQFFPALSGVWGTLEVNFGDREFRYGPPTSGFVKLVDAL